MAKVPLETYEAICRNRFEQVEEKVDAMEKKVFNGFGDALARVHKDVDQVDKDVGKLRAFIFWFIVVAGISGVSALINIVLHSWPIG